MSSNDPTSASSSALTGGGAAGTDPPRTDPDALAFLLRVAELLHAYGTPSYRLERVLQKVASSMGVEGSFLSTPTSVFVSFGRGAAKEVHLLRGESGEVNLGKLVEFDCVMEDVEHGRVRPGAAIERLERIAGAASRYPFALSALGFGTASAAAACFFGGASREIMVTFVVAIGIMALGRVMPRRPDTVGLFEPVAAFLVALGALLAARFVPPLDDRVVTLAGLIVLLPGLTLTTGFTELATRHLVSGVARIAGAGAIFLTVLLGVALAWRLGSVLLGPLPALAPPDGAPLAAALPGWSVWIAAALAPFAFAVLLEARPQEIGAIFGTGLAGYAAARLGLAYLGADLGPFVGALVVGILSNLYARRTNRPALVPLTPGILMLVPGSLGFRSLTSFLDDDSLAGMEWAFQTGVVAAALVAGLLAANVVVPPRRVL